MKSDTGSTIGKQTSHSSTPSILGMSLNCLNYYRVAPMHRLLLNLNQKKELVNSHPMTSRLMLLNEPSYTRLVFAKIRSKSCINFVVLNAGLLAID